MIVTRPAITAAIDEIRVPVLPRDRAEAFRMIAEGDLDSTVWQAIEPFYTTPISVPRGDLEILSDLFQNRLGDLPISRAELAKYIPWNIADQQRFFSDHPELLPFRPILSFAYRSSPRIPGRVGFYFSRWESQDTAREYALFSIGDLTNVRANGRVDFTNTYGRWYRRSVTASLDDTYKFSCGNFSPQGISPLFYGYFPSAPRIDTIGTDSWLYGISHSWNGVMLHATPCHNGNGPGPAAGGEFFFHVRPTEEIGSLKGTLSVSSHSSLFGNASRLTTIDSTGEKNRYHYLCYGFNSTVIDGWKFELQSGFDTRNPHVMPCDVECSFAPNAIVCKGSLIYLPKGFSAPRSGTGRLLLSHLDMTDTATDHIIGADLTFYLQQCPFFSYSPRLNCVFTGDRIRYLLAGATISGQGRVDYRCSYSWSPDFLINGETLYHQQGNLALSLMLSKTAFLEYSQRTFLSSQGYWSTSCTFFPRFQLHKAISLAPFIYLTGTNSSDWEKRLGIEQKLEIGENTFSEISVEHRLPFSATEFLNLNGKMSFVF